MIITMITAMTLIVKNNNDDNNNDDNDDYGNDDSINDIDYNNEMV